MTIRSTGTAFAASLAISLALGLVAMPGPIEAAGFNCKYARTHVEKLICANQELSKLDDEMKSLYDQVRSETRGIDGETGQVRDPADKAQKLWRETVRDVCTDAACLKTAYRAHIAEWRKTYADILSAPER